MAKKGQDSGYKNGDRDEKNSNSSEDDAERKAQVHVADGLSWTDARDDDVPDNTLVLKLGSSSSSPSSGGKRMSQVHLFLTS